MSKRPAPRAIFKMSSRIALSAALALGGSTVYAETRDRDGKNTSVQKKEYTPAEAIKAFAKDLTKTTARRPFFGRSDTIADIISRFQAIDEKGVLLEADPGAGKSAIKFEVARLIREKNPKAEVWDINLGAIRGNAIYNGEEMERLSKVIEYLREDPVNRFAIIDEMHRLKDYDSFVEEMKDDLEQGRLAALLMTTFKDLKNSEMRRKNPAFFERLLPLKLAAATPAEILTTLRLNLPRLEAHYGVMMGEDAMRAIVRAVPIAYPSDSGRRKAMNVASQIMAFEKYQRENGRLTLLIKRDELAAKIHERDSLRKEVNRNPHGANAEAYQDELAIVEGEVSAIKEEIKAMVPDNRVGDLEKKLIEARAEKTRLIEAGESKMASLTAHSTIPDLERQLVEAKALVTKGAAGYNAILNEHDVSHYIARDTGMRPEFLTMTVTERLESVRKELNKVKGNENLKRLILQNLETRWNESLPVIGPGFVAVIDGLTGAGKSAIIRALAFALTGSASNIVEISMNSIGEHGAMGVVGSGPGLVNSNEGGALEPFKHGQALHGQELDKAPRSIVNIFHELLDVGYMKDAMGEMVDARGKLVVFSSNYTGPFTLLMRVMDNRQLEKHYGLKPNDLGDAKGEDLKARFLDMRMRATNIDPSMLGRIPLRMMIEPITPETSLEIVKDQLTELSKHYRTTYRWDITFDKSVAEYIAHQTYNPFEGARPTIDGTRKQIAAFINEQKRLIAQLKLDPKNAGASVGPSSRTKLIVKLDEALDPQYKDVMKSTHEGPVLQMYVEDKVTMMPLEVPARRAAYTLDSLISEAVGQAGQAEEVRSDVTGRENKPMSIYRSRPSTKRPPTSRAR